MIAPLQEELAPCLDPGAAGEPSRQTAKMLKLNPDPFPQREHKKPGSPELLMTPGFSLCYNRLHGRNPLTG